MARRGKDESTLIWGLLDPTSDRAFRGPGWRRRGVPGWCWGLVGWGFHPILSSHSIRFLADALRASFFIFLVRAGLLGHGAIQELLPSVGNLAFTTWEIAFPKGGRWNEDG